MQTTVGSASAGKGHLQEGVGTQIGNPRLGKAEKLCQICPLPELNWPRHHL